MTGSSSSSAGYNLVIGEFLLMAAACFLLLRHYAASMVSLDVLVVVYLSWILGFMGVLLLPYDLSKAITYDERSAQLLEVWTFVYWSTLFCAWVMLPLQMGFHTSGHFSFHEKLRDSLYKLLLTAALALVVGVVYVIYMLATSGGSLNSIIGFVMAMGNTYGVLIITLLMGSGLVAVPRQLWRMGDTGKELLDLYISASYVEESYIEACYELEDCEADVRKVVAVTTMRLSPRHSTAAAATTALGTKQNSAPATASVSTDDIEDGVCSRSGASGSSAVAAAAESLVQIDELNRIVSILRTQAEDFQLLNRSHIRSTAVAGAAPAVSLSMFEELTKKNKLVALHAKLMNAQLKARSCEKRWFDFIARCDRCVQSIERRSRPLQGRPSTAAASSSSNNISATTNSTGVTASAYRSKGSSSSSSSKPAWSVLPAADGSTVDSGAAPAATSTAPSSTFSLSSLSYYASEYSATASFYVSRLYSIWRTRFYSHSCRAAAIVCAAASLLILWCELVTSSDLNSPIGVMMTAYSFQRSNPVMVQGVSFLFLAYMSICTYWPLFQLNIGFSYQLQGPQLSPPSSLIFNAQYLSRLQFALGYNFLGAINVPRADKAAFRMLLKSMELVPVFGTSFTVYVPLVLVVVALLTYCNGYERLLQTVGIEYEQTIPSDNTAAATLCCISGKSEPAITSSSSADSSSDIGGSSSALDVDVSGIKNSEMLDKVRTGKRIVARELKRLRNAVTLHESEAINRNNRFGISRSQSNGGVEPSSGSGSKYSSGIISSGGIGKSRYGKLEKREDTDEEIVFNPIQHQQQRNSSSQGNTRGSNSQSHSTSSPQRSLPEEGSLYGGRYSNISLGDRSGSDSHLAAAVKQRDLFSILPADEDEDAADVNGSLPQTNLFTGRYANL